MGLAIGGAHLHFEVRVRQRRPHQIIRRDGREEFGFQLYLPIDVHSESAPGRGVFKGSLIHDLPDAWRSSHPDIADIVDSE
jgi:hypothetical protein